MKSTELIASTAEHIRQPARAERRDVHRDTADPVWDVRDANDTLIAFFLKREVAEELVGMINVGWKPLTIRPIEVLVRASEKLRTTQAAVAVESPAYVLLLDMEAQIRSMTQRLQTIALAPLDTPRGWARDLAEQELRSAPMRMRGTYDNA